MRKNQFFWGLVAIAAGVILLMQTMGILTAAFWPIFWAVMLILLGVWFLVGPRFARPSASEEKLSIPLGSEVDAEITLEHGAGRLEVHALELTGSLLEGSFAGGVEHRQSVEGGTVHLQLQPRRDAYIVPPFDGVNRLDWNLGLAREIPMKLLLKTGASENNLELADLHIGHLKIETGASSTRVTLPAHAGFTRAEIISGAASMEITIPVGVSASITVESGLSSLQIDPQRFPQSGNMYRSPDYDSAGNRVELIIKSGVGSVVVA